MHEVLNSLLAVLMVAGMLALGAVAEAFIGDR